MQPSCTSWACLLLAAMLQAAQPPALQVTVRDGSGAAVSGAVVQLIHQGSGARQTAISSAEGAVQFDRLPAGAYSLEAVTSGFSPVRRQLRIDARNATAVEVVLQPSTLSQEVMVSAGRIVGTPEHLERLPGSVSVLNQSALLESRVFTIEEALRKVPGIHARAEEGFGLRPNIGIRGLNPTRSTRVLLLEDGLPLSYAPYGDNASYYHPPVERFDSIEVVKGGGQILYGPMTVGGVVNYITPAAPAQPSGAITLMGGNRDYLNGHARWGTTIRKTGLLFDAMRKQGEGARENLRHGLSDFSARSLSSLGSQQSLGLRFNYYKEDSNIAYSGLREAEWLANPRGNPFRNDFFYIDRYGTSAVHTWAPASNFVLNTSAYGNVFLRDWWRQSSNSGQRPNDSADPLCGGMANLNTTCGNEGRLRKYYTWGIEPKVRASHTLFGVSSETDFGFRYHAETQERIQRNGDTPTARTGRIVEDNQRLADAVSTFVQNRFLFGKWSITPGFRLEHVDFDRTNRLAGVRGKTSLTQAIPGIGVAYQAAPGVTLFSGLHRGFAPPRVEDVINNNTGQTIDLDPELSWNFEAGARVAVSRRLRLEATYFNMDFENQIIPASVAGGAGAVLTNAGETSHRGAEFAWQWDVRSIATSRHSVSLRGAYTWVPVSRFEGSRFSAISGFTNVSVTGNRLPYSPENLLTASVLYTHAGGVNAFIESVYTGAQFGDDLNTRAGSADGQRGLLPGYPIWNATLNYPLEQLRTTAFFTVKNAFDRLAVADRTRGLLPTAPRLFQAGLRFTF